MLIGIATVTQSVRLQASACNCVCLIEASNSNDNGVLGRRKQAITIDTKDCLARVQLDMFRALADKASLRTSNTQVDPLAQA